MNPWDLSCRPKPTSSLSASPSGRSQGEEVAQPQLACRPVQLDHCHRSEAGAQLERLLPYAALIGGDFGQTLSTNSSPLSSSSASSRSDGLELNHERRADGHQQTASSAGPTVQQVVGASQQQQQPDRKARKKDQNRRAAYNYRRKKMEEKNRMREEEMRLVYSRVCLIGYAEELEGSIMYILNTKTRKILDNDGNAICFLCPVCLQSCDNTLNLRNHLNLIHSSNNNQLGAH